MSENNTNFLIESVKKHAKNIIQNEIYKIVSHQGDSYITLNTLNDELYYRLLSQKINRPIVVNLNSPDSLMKFLQGKLNKILDDVLLESIRLHIGGLYQIGLELGRELSDNIGIAFYDDSFQTEISLSKLSKKSSSILGDVYSINGTTGDIPWAIYSKDYQFWVIALDVLHSMKNGSVQRYVGTAGETPITPSDDVEDKRIFTEMFIDEIKEDGKTAIGAILEELADAIEAEAENKYVNHKDSHGGDALMGIADEIRKLIKEI